MKKTLISIVVPVFNEQDTIRELYDRLTLVFHNETEYNFECVFVENGSKDSSLAEILSICEEDSRVKLLQLSRNFRMGGAVTAGLDYVSGAACVVMAGDLQDPPEDIPKFLRLWEAGVENVYARISRREGVPFIRRLNAQVFYLVANVLSGGLIERNVSDFRLVDRKVYLAIREMRERTRFMRGLFSWAGFSSASLVLVRPARVAGRSKADFRSVAKLAIHGIFAHSLVPLRIILAGGATLAFFALGYLAWLFWRVMAFGVPFDGFGTLLGITVLGFGFLFVALGVIGEYLAIVFEEVKGRPNYIVRAVHGLTSSQVSPAESAG